MRAALRLPMAPRALRCDPQYSRFADGPAAGIRPFPYVFSIWIYGPESLIDINGPLLLASWRALMCYTQRRAQATTGITCGVGHTNKEDLLPFVVRYAGLEWSVQHMGDAGEAAARPSTARGSGPQQILTQASCLLDMRAGHENSRAQTESPRQLETLMSTSHSLNRCAEIR